MKNVGSYFEYEEARNKDLMRAFRTQLSAKENISMKDVYVKVVNMRSERFWVSEERAAIVISNLIRGGTLDGMRPTKQEMYREILRQVLAMRKKNPRRSIYDCTFDVVNSEAPKFYLTPGSAKVIINKIKGKWYERKERRSHRLY